MAFSDGSLRGLAIVIHLPVSLYSKKVGFGTFYLVN
nr:MAG TPA: hypothetical protein [Caudoviricetes sp.]